MSEKAQNYYRQKALRVKELLSKGLPFVKVYAPVRVGDKFMVLKQTTDKGISYNISGGGVDDGESLEDAIKRELREELGVEVEIIKELGIYDKMYKTWRLDDEELNIQYEIHVFDTRLVKQLDKDMGLEGEFEEKKVEIALIDKDTLVNNVAEFCKFGIKID